MRENRGWFLWCGVGTVDEEHTEITGLTKREAVDMAESMTGKWPRVLVGQTSSRHPRGVILGGIEYGRKSGVVLL